MAQLHLRDDDCRLEIERKEKFPELFDEAFRIIRDKEQINISTIQTRICKEVHYGESTVYNWRKGHTLPRRSDYFVFLVRYCIDNAELDRDWLEKVLSCVSDDYLSPSQKQALYDEFFPSKDVIEAPRIDHTIPDNIISFFLIRLQNLYRSTPVLTSIGSLYVDEKIKYSDEVTDNMEVIIKEPKRYELGGSCFHFAKYLSMMGLSTRLISVRGRSKSDPDTRIINQLISSEDNELLEFHIPELGDENSITGSTIIIEQPPRKSIRTMITYPGVLSEFNWQTADDKLEPHLEKGGIIYIGGYFKTALHQCLDIYLGKYRKTGSLICLDHGRLTSKESLTESIESLYEVFFDYLVDVYLCTVSEFWNLCHTKLPPLASDEHVKRELKQLLQKAELRRVGVKFPPFTIIRDEKLPGDTKVYLIFEGDVFPIKLERPNHAPQPKCKSPSLFNAAFVCYLANEASYKAKDSEEKDYARELVIKAIKFAIKHWMN